MTQHIQQQVDQLLLEQGEYLPLEFLLQEGRLSYSDYEAWRSGELEYLDDALFGESDHIHQQLMQAEDYLQQRGWQAEALSYSAWHKQSHSNSSQPAFQSESHPLCFSLNNKLNRCFHRCYRKPQEQPQLDLFTDAPSTNLVNGIIETLINRNGTEARRLLESLYQTTPDHIRLGELEHLVEAAEDLHTAVNDTAADLQYLRETLMPLAESLLGKDSRNLIIPLWRRLSKALQNQPYQPAEPELHLSFTATQAMDWDTVRQAVEQEPHWQTDPVLLLRHAWACGQLHQQAAALLSWFNLCWRFPKQFDALESSFDSELHQQWIAFQELEPELPAQTFPAWLLMCKPGLTKILTESSSISDKDKLAYPASYLTLFQLQNIHMRSHAEHGNEVRLTTGKDKNTMTLRAELKQQDPVLFQHFLGNIDA